MEEIIWRRKIFEAILLLLLVLLIIGVFLLNFLHQKKLAEQRYQLGNKQGGNYELYQREAKRSTAGLDEKRISRKEALASVVRSG